MRSVWAVPSMIVALCICASAQEPTNEAKKLWDEHVMGKPNPCILDDFEVIEGMPLLRAAGDIEPRTAALATVAFKTGGVVVTDFHLTSKDLAAYAAELKGDALTPDQRLSVEKLAERVATECGEQPAVPHYATFLLGYAFCLQRTFKGARSVEECLGRLAKLRGWVATLEKSADSSFENFRESVDKGIPVLLQRREDFLVCFGYLVADGREYLVLDDPRYVPLEKGGPVGPVTPEEEEGAKTSEFVRGYIKNRAEMLKDRVTDFRSGSKKPLVHGLSIEPFEKGKYRAYFIYGWHVSAEAWRKEIEEITGPPKGNK